MLKKFIAVMLAFAMVFSVSAVGWATEDVQETVEETSEYALLETEAIEEITEYTPLDEAAEEEITESEENEIVATLYLCSNITVWPVVGHAWIYVKNLSDEAINVGYYTGVESGRGVSVGAFSFSVWDGWGIYYNLEAYRERNNDGYLYVSRDMTQSDLDKLNDALVNYPNYWGIVGNCATFAFSMWNTVTGSAYISLLIPAITHFTVLLMGGRSGEQIMTPVAENEVKRQSNGQLVDIEHTNL